MATEERNERLEKLRSAIARLSERQQYLIKAIFFKGKTQIDIALEIGVSKQAVSNAIHRALTSLKKLLEEN